VLSHFLDKTGISRLYAFPPRSEPRRSKQAYISQEFHSRFKYKVHSVKQYQSSFGTHPIRRTSVHPASQGKSPFGSMKQDSFGIHNPRYHSAELIRQIHSVVPRPNQLHFPSHRINYKLHLSPPTTGPTSPPNHTPLNLTPDQPFSHCRANSPLPTTESTSLPLIAEPKPRRTR
jgi:hypothetical protein